MKTALDLTAMEVLDVLSASQVVGGINPERPLVLLGGRITKPIPTIQEEMLDVRF